MTTDELAHAMLAMIREGRFADAQEQLWSDAIVSIEPLDSPMAHLSGRSAVMQKMEWWSANHEVHGVEVDGPYVHGTQFALRMTLDVTPRDGTRMRNTEIVLYSTADGIVTEERYFYGQ